uniref:Uncharacterized protein n=1 Tax=Pyrodinium bahamense TaxID=73915 RepID=A0A7S0AKF9_9DINO
MGADGEDLARACAYAMTTLVDGSSAQAQALRQAGAAEALARLSLKGHGGLDEEAAVWALGQLNGLGAVLEAMARAPSSGAVLRGGVEAIAELAWHCSAPGEVTRLPQVLGALVALLGQADMPVSRPHCIVAIGSAACGLAPHAEPGRLPELDRAVTVLLETLRSEPPEDMDAAEMAVEALGRLALIAPAWREGLKNCGAVGALALQIDGGHGSKGLSRYCFWAAGAVLGLPFVVHELRLHLKSAETVDMALCTIAEILDDDLDSEFALKRVEGCSEAAVPSVLALVAEAMQAHSSDSEVQRHGCQCAGLLAALVPPAAAPQEAVAAVLNAARRHCSTFLVVQQACAALRAFLGPRRRLPTATANGAATAASQEGLEALAALLRQEDAGAIAERCIADFAGSGDPETLEHAAVVLAALSGVGATLSALAEAGPGQVWTAGVKALFEFGRLQPTVLCRAAEDMASAVAAMLAESPEDDALRQSAALLLGLCGVELPGSEPGGGPQQQAGEPATAGAIGTGAPAATPAIGGG